MMRIVAPQAGQRSQSGGVGSSAWSLSVTPGREPSFSRGYPYMAGALGQAWTVVPAVEV